MKEVLFEQGLTDDLFFNALACLAGKADWDRPHVLAVADAFYVEGLDRIDNLRSLAHITDSQTTLPKLIHRIGLYGPTPDLLRKGIPLILYGAFAPLADRFGALISPQQALERYPQSLTPLLHVTLADLEPVVIKHSLSLDHLLFNLHHKHLSFFSKDQYIVETQAMFNNVIERVERWLGDYAKNTV